MLFALVSAAFASDPLVIDGIDELTDVPTVWSPVTNVDFVDGVQVNGPLLGPSIGYVSTPNPKWEGSFIVLRESFFPEIAASVRSIN